MDVDDAHGMQYAYDGSNASRATWEDAGQPREENYRWWTRRSQKWMFFDGSVRALRKLRLLLERGLDVAVMERELASSAGKACICTFSILCFVMAEIHFRFLNSELRFVYAANKAIPSGIKTHRFVRLLDVLVSFSWGLLSIFLVYSLQTNRMTPSYGMRVLINSVSAVVVAYMCGAIVDVVQCTYADGVGRSCNGNACVSLALTASACLATAHICPGMFFPLCFGGEGVYRLMWVRKLWKSAMAVQALATPGPGAALQTLQGIGIGHSKLIIIISLLLLVLPWVNVFGPAISFIFSGKRETSPPNSVDFDTHVDEESRLLLRGRNRDVY